MSKLYAPGTAAGSTMPNGQLIVQQMAPDEQEQQKQEKKVVATPQALIQSFLDKPNENLKTIICSDGQTITTEVLSETPPIILFHNLISKEEAKALIKLGGPRWQQSITVGAVGHASRTSTGRTSSSALIGHLKTPALKAVATRVRHLTGILNVQLDLLKYEKGQQFHVHHDDAERKYTFVIYLNDLLGKEDGGETHFPYIKNLKIKPKCGTALFFCNRINPHAPEHKIQPDNRIMHAGLPVLCNKTKYVVNAWLIPKPTRLGYRTTLVAQDHEFT